MNMRRRRSRSALTLAVIGALVVGAAASSTRDSLALLSSSNAVGSGAVRTASSWTTTVTAGLASLSSDAKVGGFLRQGTSFYIYANALENGVANPALTLTADVSAVASGKTAVTLVAGNYTYPTGGTAYAYRSALITTNATLAAGTYSWSIATTDSRSQVVTTQFSVEVSTTYVLGATTGQTGTRCTTASGGKFDMMLGYVPTGAEKSRTSPGSADRLSFCSDTWTASARIPAGTTTVTLTYQNTSTTKTCAVTATLWRNTSSRGSTSKSIAPKTTRTTGTWQFSTSATTFSAGDRLVLTVDFVGGNVCNQTTVYWNSSTAPSKVVTP